MNGDAAPVNPGGGDPAPPSTATSFWNSWPVLRNQPDEAALVFLCSHGRTWTAVADELTGIGQIRFETRHTGDAAFETASAVLAASPDHFLLIAASEDGDVADAVGVHSGTRKIGYVLVDPSADAVVVAEMVRGRMDGVAS